MNKLLELRTKKGVSQQDVADYIHVSRQMYASFEKGIKEPTEVQLHNLACYFDVTVNYLLGETAEKAKQKCLSELRKILASYNPTDFTLFFLYELALIVVVIIISATVGYLLSLVLIGFMAMPVFKYFDPANSELKEKAERACELMSQCNFIYNYPGNSRMWDRVEYRYNESNIDLYNRFIANYPEMQSEKLKKLSKVKFSRY